MAAGRHRFVWYDLMTTDTTGAKAFYAAIAGWTTAPMGDYSLWKVGETPVGGMQLLSEREKAERLPPRWLAHVRVDSVDEKVEQARRLGGHVTYGPEDIPEIGRFALIRDPQGAAFFVLSLLAPGEAPAQDAVGRFGWAELNTTDWESAWRFYSSLFGWKKTDALEMGDLGTYFMFGLDEKMALGGMSNAARAMNLPPHWLHYLNVEDADETAKRIVELGGKVVQGPMDIPGGDRIAVCADPQGAHFGIFSPGRKG